MTIRVYFSKPSPPGVAANPFSDAFDLEAVPRVGETVRYPDENQEYMVLSVSWRLLHPSPFTRPDGRVAPQQTAHITLGWA